MSLYGCAEALVEAREELRMLYNELSQTSLNFRGTVGRAFKEYEQSSNQTKTGEIEQTLRDIGNEATEIADALISLRDRAHKLRVWIGQI